VGKVQEKENKGKKDRFGEQTNGRICPGKHIAENVIIEMLIALGKCRRGVRTNPPRQSPKKTEKSGLQSYGGEIMSCRASFSDFSYSLQ
jgi:hypothetical protein